MRAIRTGLSDRPLWKSSGVTFSGVVDLSSTPDEPEFVSQVLVSPKGTRYLAWADEGFSEFSNTNVFFDAVP
jgi:hypothetical protein